MSQTQRKGREERIECVADIAWIDKRLPGA